MTTDEVEDSLQQIREWTKDLKPNMQNLIAIDRTLAHLLTAVSKARREVENEWQRVSKIVEAHPYE
jgi:hypothetical protein